MGYYTTFAVTAQQDGTEIEFSQEMRNALLEIFEEMDSENIDELTDGWYNAKWYEYEEDLKKLSELFPMLFSPYQDRETNLPIFGNATLKTESPRWTRRR